MSGASRLDIRKIGGRIGAEVVGVDVRDLSDAAFAEIRSALLEHKVLGFRGQELTMRTRSPSPPGSARSPARTRRCRR